MRSTSIHNLNADRGLNPLEKSVYLFLNFLNNLFPYRNLDKRIQIRSFAGEAWKKELKNTYQTSSVGRRLSDLFWRTLPWAEIEKELGEIHVFDTGCGQGNYSTRLLSASSGRVKSYTGIDVKRRESWSLLGKDHPNFRFIESSSTNIKPLIPWEANFFITQSAIEHFDEDLSFFEQIKEFVEKTGRPVIQIHNFPAKAALSLYLFHGIRQYTPRNISKITKMFDKAYIYLYELGGKAGKRLQFKYFTWPQLILRGQAKWSDDVEKYDMEVREAIGYDINHPTSSPLFWVLIIHSHPREKIW